MADIADEIAGNTEELRSLLRQSIRDLTTVLDAVERGTSYAPSQLHLTVANTTAAYGRASAIAALRSAQTDLDAAATDKE